MSSPPGDPVSSKPGTVEVVDAQAAQPPVPHLEWSAAWGGCGNKKGGRVPRPASAGPLTSPRFEELASTLGESKVSGGRDVCVWWSGTRDERTMTCMQQYFVSLARLSCCPYTSSACA